MIPRWYARSLAFALPEAGFDYFSTEMHYRSLAGRIVAALGGFSVVVVTGDPPPTPQILYTALIRAAASHYSVIGFSCGPELGRDQLLCASRPFVSTAANRTTTEYPPPPSAAPPLFVFDDAAQLSDEQIELIFDNICVSTQRRDHRIAGAVLLAPSDFLARLEQPMLRLWLGKRLLAARLRLHELGADEVVSFIRHQLPADEAGRVFTKEAVLAIANVSGGDPTLINRFSRRLLDFPTTNATKIFMNAVARPSEAEPPESRVESLGFATFGEPRRDARVLAPTRDRGAPVWIQKWGGIRATARRAIAILVCFAGVGGIGVLFTHSAGEKASDFGTRRGGAFATVLQDELSVEEARRPGGAGAVSDSPAPGPVHEVLAGFRAELASAATASATPTLEAASNTAGLTMAAPTTVARHSWGAAAPAGPGEHATPAAAPAAAAPSFEKVPTGAVVAAPMAAPAGVMASATRYQGVSPAGAGRTAAKKSATARPEASPTIAIPPPTTAPAQPLPLAAEITALIARGNRLLDTGDVASARLFYERAAEVGDGEAALKLGKTFDPAFLSFGRLSGIRGDPAMAIPWYRRARDLGQAEAEIQLERLDPVTPK